MMDREKRRNLIRKIVRFWFEHNLLIAVILAAVFIGTTITVVSVCLSGSKKEVVTQIEKTDFSSVLDNTSGKKVKNKKKNSVTLTPGVSAGVEEEYEYTTVLQYNESTREGYMNNCIFLGDSRTVAMVSYGFVSDENVLAKVGISHTSVLNSSFIQNSGKEYTIDKYLDSHKAPVIYLGYGVNGMSGGSSEKYELAYKELVEHIIEKAPDSDIVLMAIWPVDDYGPYKNTCQNSWIDNYNLFLKSLAEYEGIYYLDVDSVLKTENGQIKPEYDAGDGLHYRACAYTTILQYIVHHPVPGVSDEGEFVVKYVKPTGQFKKMVTEKTELPANVEIIDEDTGDSNDEYDDESEYDESEYDESENEGYSDEENTDEESEESDENSEETVSDDGENSENGTNSDYVDEDNNDESGDIEALLSPSPSPSPIIIQEENAEENVNEGEIIEPNPAPEE